MIKIIAADDEQYLINALPGLVPWDELGCTLVKVCKNGRELIDSIDDIKPDIVITDIRMPIMDGIEVCKYIHENYSNVKIIVLSAYSDFSYARNAMKYDVSEYILKADVVEELPIAIEKLVKSINTKDNEIPKGFSDKDLYNQMCEYIDIHYREEFSLSDLAEELHANPSYLSRLFKNKSGSNLFDEIVRRRMEKAKECLLITDMKINDIAEYVGFSDASYFSRLFKKMFNISPRDYRLGRL